MKEELFYQEYVQRENEILHAPYLPEMEFYFVIQSGNIPKIKELCQQKLDQKEGLGVLSKNSLQNMKYHFVITTAMVARYCIEGGMEVSAAYNLSDFYIQKADQCTSIQSISDLHPVMCLDYGKRMKNLRKQKVRSLPVARCIDYIYENLHTRITVEELAERIQLTPSYLSRLFKKETGSSISEYIQQKKIDTAKNMLIYSEYSPAQISSTLAFPSQSYFCAVFKKKTGLTPMKYRMHYFRSSPMQKGSNRFKADAL